jgi:hypothetical protein
MLVKQKYEALYDRVDLMRRQRRAATVPESLSQLRTTLPCISLAKYKDLANLCQKQLIPQAYHSYFQSVQHEENSGANASTDSDTE